MPRLRIVALSPIDMPVIKVNNVQYPLHPGQNRLGGGDDADVRLHGSAALGIEAIVDVADDAQAVIRRVGDGGVVVGADAIVVRVNGIRLVDPTPLMHGDKIEIDGNELLYSDDTKSGNTSHISTADIAALVRTRPAAARATTGTGGRLVSLVDGKEYPVPAGGITIGRDAGAGVVVAENDVSRKHAVIASGENGYEVRDFSANGVFVNANRVDTSQLLARADVIRVGSEEFRFYADVRPWPAAAVVGLALAPEDEPDAPGDPVDPLPPSRTAPPPAEARTSAAAPAPPNLPNQPPTQPSPVRAADQVGSDERPLLAVLEISNPGPASGQQFQVHVPLAHIGRGAHNDIVLADDSVSDTHAKLQRRDEGWYVVDVGSTNGTYVGGERITEERMLQGGGRTLDLRFGGVKMIFRANDAPPGSPGATRAIATVDRASLRPTTHATSVRTSIAAPVAANASPETPKRQALPVWVWSVVVLAIVAAVFFLMNR